MKKKDRWLCGGKKEPAQRKKRSLLGAEEERRIGGESCRKGEKRPYYRVDRSGARFPGKKKKVALRRIFGAKRPAKRPKRFLKTFGQAGLKSAEVPVVERASLAGGKPRKRRDDPSASAEEGKGRGADRKANRRHTGRPKEELVAVE